VEDSTFEGWTSPVMDYPDGRMLPGPPRPGYMGEVRSLPLTSDDAVKYACRSWPQGRPEDFDREGQPRWKLRALSEVTPRHTRWLTSGLIRCVTSPSLPPSAAGEVALAARSHSGGLSSRHALGHDLRLVRRCG
jgi:hypothetical protein